ncbi:MAG: hypothetical protein DMG02_21815 [Acidobacteria bacterium]|nr:MAG: hypothetical protein DMG02_21815 [Acidobacteriota bacterium]
MPGVVVKARSAETGLEREAITSVQGLYVINYLPAGRYDVSAELSGFKTARFENVTLDVGERRTLDIKLEVGPVQEIVTVLGAAPLVERTSPELSTVVQSTQLKELPLNGRHWSSLMMLAPGAINTGAGTHTSIRFVGRLVDDNNWTFDGVDATGVKDPKQESVARLIISMESIAEFRVSSSQYSAETGSAGGGVVQLISKAARTGFAARRTISCATTASMRRHTGNRIGLDRTQAATLNYPIDPFLAQALTSGRSPRALALHRHDLYVEQYSANVQQALRGDFTLQVGYIGSCAHNLFSRSFVNVIDPATGRRPLPSFGQVDIKSNTGRATFNAMQVLLRRRFSRGLLVGLEYMLSQARNDGSIGGGDANAPQNVSDPQADWGDSAQDVRHNLIANWVYELPLAQAVDGLAGRVLRGWQASGLVQIRSGRPLTILVTRARTDVPDGNSGNSSTSGSQQRPDLVPGVPLVPPSAQSPDLWINPAVFAVPARGRWGNAPRSLLTGPGLAQVDFALTRRFAMSADRNVEVRWEIFNLFNRQNLANPNVNISSGPSFGRITGPANPDFGTGSARQMQFMFRLNF